MFIVYYIETISYGIGDGRRVREDKGETQNWKRNVWGLLKFIKQWEGLSRKQLILIEDQIKGEKNKIVKQKNVGKVLCDT